VLELFVVYPSGPIAWTAELLRRGDGSEQWSTVFKITVSDRSKLDSNLRELWPRVMFVELHPVIQ